MVTYSDQNSTVIRNITRSQKWLSGKRLWIDCTDILRYASAGNCTVSGIQRVIVNTVLSLQQLGIAYATVASDHAGLKLIAISTAGSLSLFADLQSGECTPSDIKAKCSQVHASAEVWSPEADDVILIAGAFWLHDPSLLLELRQVPQLRIVTFMHDVLIWRYPDYFLPTDRTIWLSAFAQILSMSDVILTSSKYVADEIRSCAMALGLPCPDVLRIGMASTFPTIMSGGPSSTVRQLVGERFVLCVGTLEARKNHSFLLDIWDRLHAEYGQAAPRLVFAGKIGWKVAPLVSRMQNLEWGETHFLHIDSASDGDLTWLYSHCLFSVYLSLAEGWGLPISESLAHGTPCLAADTASLPEAGGDLALYSPPDDIDAAVSQVRRLLIDDFREQLRTHIHDNFLLRSWKDFTIGLLNASSGCMNSRSDLALPVEQRCPIGMPSRETDIACRAAALATLVTGWRHIQDDAVYGGPIMKMGFLVRTHGAEELSFCCLAALPGGGVIHVENEQTGERWTWIFPSNGAEVKQIPLSIASFNYVTLTMHVEARGEIAALYGMGISRSFPASETLIQALLELIVPGSTNGELIADGLNLIGGLAPSPLRFIPPLARLFLKRARRAARLRNWAVARINYSALLRLRPEDGAAWKQLGHVCKELEDFSGAYTAYAMALIYTGDADSRFHASVMREQMRWHKATG